MVTLAQPLRQLLEEVEDADAEVVVELCPAPSGRWMASRSGTRPSTGAPLVVLADL